MMTTSIPYSIEKEYSTIEKQLKILSFVAGFAATLGLLFSWLFTNPYRKTVKEISKSLDIVIKSADESLIVARGLEKGDVKQTLDKLNYVLKEYRAMAAKLEKNGYYKSTQLEDKIKYGLSLMYNIQIELKKKHISYRRCHSNDERHLAETLAENSNTILPEIINRRTKVDC